MRTLPNLILAVGLTLGLCHTTSAQIAVHEFNVVSQTYGVRSKFTFTVDPGANVLTVRIDNTIAGVNGYKGNIVGFGFNTPFTNTQLGNNGSNVWIDNHTTQLNPGHSQPGDWTKSDPFSMAGGQYTQDFGVWAPTPKPQNGIQHGEKAWFVFAFPDFTASQVSGFFDGTRDLMVRYQEVGKNGCYEYSDYGWANDCALPVPEPSTYGLIGAAGLLGLVSWRRMKRKA